MSNQESFLSVKHWRNFLNEKRWSGPQKIAKCGPGETLIKGGDQESDMCADTEELESFIAFSISSTF